MEVVSWMFMMHSRRRDTRLPIGNLRDHIARSAAGAVALRLGVLVEVGGVVSDSEGREGEDDGSGAHLDGVDLEVIKD